MKIFGFFLGFLLVVPLAHGQQVVTDYTSYSYYADQLTQAQRMITQMKESLKEAKRVRTAITNLRTELNTAYNAVFGVIGGTKRLIDEAKGLGKAAKDGRENVMKELKCFVASAIAA